MYSPCISYFRIHVVNVRPNINATEHQLTNNLYRAMKKVIHVQEYYTQTNRTSRIHSTRTKIMVQTVHSWIKRKEDLIENTTLYFTNKYIYAWIIKTTIHSN